MAHHRPMLFLLALIATLIVGLLAVHYGADSRRDVKNW